MYLNKKLICFIIVISLTRLWSTVSGNIKNQYGLAIPSAKVTFVDQNDSTNFETNTDEEGRFQIDIPITAITTEGSNKLLSPYPNPNRGAVYIPFYQNKEGKITIEIYDILGRKVNTLSKENSSKGFNQIKWNCINSAGKSVSTGIYIVVFRTFFANESSVDYKKITVLGKGNSSIMKQDINKLVNGPTELISYDIIVESSNGKADTLYDVNFNINDDQNYYVNIEYSLPFKTSQNYLNIFNGEAYHPIFIKGVNLGVATPGTQPGQMAATREQYKRWIKKMGEIGINSIRTYTLHYPRFYEELASYNKSNPEHPIYLFQGVWLKESVPEDDLYNLTEDFSSAIEEIIDCSHGNRIIGHRYGEAYGEYTTDVSQWIMGYILGREIHPHEILTTDSLHSEQNYFGDKVSINNSTPTEAWLAQQIDKTIQYEDKNYNTERPVSISNWPTLDPLTHPTEPEYPYSSEDMASFDLSNLNMSDMKGGYFASYHAYPYFPDFINEEPDYREYTDQWGPNSYLGYLNDLKGHYDEFPLIIAEYGVPSSWGNAHFSQSGMHHGDRTEMEQGEDNVRLLNNMYDSDCGGGMLFAWIDEWFKTAWITNPRGSESDRRHFWHNITSPEQNYGLIKFVENEPDFNVWPSEDGTGNINKIDADYDNQYFYLSLGIDSFNLDDTLWIAYDTYRSDLGESILPNGTKINKRAEFTLRITRTDTSNLYVTQAYDLFGIYHKTSKPEQLYHSIATDGAPWNLVRWKINSEESEIFEIGKIKNKKVKQKSTNQDGVRFYKNKIIVRMPWTLLQYTDPSQREVIHDNRSTTERETFVSQGIAITAIYEDTISETDRFKWRTWDKAPEVVEKEKKSMDIFDQGLDKLSNRIIF